MLKRMCLAFAFILSINQVQAVIISGAVTDISNRTVNDAFDQGGIFELLDIPFLPPSGAPNTVGDNTFQTPNLYGFNEGQNIELTNILNVDIGSDIGIGTIIASHYVFFDPNNTTYQQGYVDFDSNIIGVITSQTLLNNSDSLLNNNVHYLSPTLRGLESGDSVSIGTGTESNRLYVDWSASSPGDYVRVITQFSVGGQDPCATNPPGVGGCPAVDVPEPATSSLILVPIVALTLYRKRKTSVI
ncbi:hypothetical protein [Neptunicella sp. SCSIO 80796]|uniref:hypothetical protein n=1 Tax=Neptunicella plasticusilytica TaxID=3117012 RepID=UPI003A4DA0D4